MKRLIRKKKNLVSQLMQYTHMAKGSINSICSVCNHSKCVCKNKINRKAYRLTYKDKNQKTRIVYIPKNRIRQITTMISNYAKARKLINQLIDINIKLFKLRL